MVTSLSITMRLVKFDWFTRLVVIVSKDCTILEKMDIDDIFFYAIVYLLG